MSPPSDLPSEVGCCHPLSFFLSFFLSRWRVAAAVAVGVAVDVAVVVEASSESDVATSELGCRHFFNLICLVDCLFY